MNLNKYNKVFLIGIGGIGVSAIAKMMLFLDKKVLGSDVCKSDITKELEKKGIKVFYKHRAKNIDKSLDLVIYSSAIPKNNPEFKRMLELNIEHFSYFEFLGELSKDYKTIVITGTHGKSTITALLSIMMINAKLDPTVFVGTRITDIDSNFRLGKSEYLVVEGCEYNANMLKLSPAYIGLPSIDKDHLDFYKDIDDIKNAFQEFIDKLKDRSNLVYNADNVNIKDLKIPKNAVSISLNQGSDLPLTTGHNKPKSVVRGLFVKNIIRKNQRQYFDLYFNAGKLCEIETNLPGDYNIYNILITNGLALKLGISSDIIVKTLKEFKGLWRRFEIIGEWQSNLIISDYAHHPTAIKSLLRGTREFYPNKKIVIVFQPHQEDRTQKLFDDFTKSFDFADDIILCPIYEVIGRRSKPKLTSYDLADAIRTRLQDHQKVFYAKDYDILKKKLIAYKGAVILIVGAGDIDNFARHYLKLV